MKSNESRAARPATAATVLTLIFAAGAAQAATYVVDTTSDSAGLSACTAGANDCSLRGAINNANAGGTTSTIQFDAGFFASPRTIALASDLPAVTTTLAIDGPGSGLLTVDGQNAHRPFHVLSGADLTVTAMTMAHGASDKGAAVLNNGTLSVTRCLIADNTASVSGGGLYSSPGTTLTVRDSTFSGNFGNDNTGGAITVQGGNALVTGSLFYNNTASFSGGGIYSNGTVVVANSTFFGNAGQQGSALYDDVGHGMTVINSTVAGSIIPGDGSAVRVITDTMTIRNSIVANGSPGNDCTHFNGSVDIQDSLIGDGSCGVTTGVNGNLTGDPMLGGLSANGGPTLTLALLPGSPAIDAGDDALCGDPDSVAGVDQRGVTRPQGAHCDMGAFELSDVIFGNGFDGP